MKYTYKNITNDLLQYSDYQGNRIYVVAGDIFDADQELDPNVFKKIDESTFKTKDELKELVSDAPQEVTEKPKNKFLKKLKD